jgi:poly-beta-1,6-N-acetyl-D-glucosamine biosynthesis protein PgaD
VEWPPLISSARVPRLVLARDAALTAAAWFGFGILCADAIVLAQDWLRTPAAAFSAARRPDWAGMWLELRWFVLTAAILIGWLGYWTIVRGKRMQATGHDPQPAALPLAEHAQEFGVAERDAAAWRGLRVATVRFDDEDRIVRVDPGG